MWILFALLSAIFAALTSILAKVGIEGVNSNLATAVRTVVVVIMAWGMVFLTNTQSGIDVYKRQGQFAAGDFADCGRDQLWRGPLQEFKREAGLRISRDRGHGAGRL